MYLLFATAAAATPEASLHGDVKLFFLAGASPPWFGFSDDAEAALTAAGLDEEEALSLYGLGADPFAQGIASARLKGMAAAGPVRLDVHYAVALETARSTGSVVGFGTGVALRAPELLPLTWSPDLGPDVTLRHRLDRLVLSAKLDQVDLALGRQPVSFGVGHFFTPMDLVNPFHPATIDSEYKPGVDALRVDVYGGTSAKVTVVGAWAGDPLVGPDRDDAEWDDLVVAASGQATVGVTDLLGFLGSVRAEPVAGVGTVSSIGPVGVHAEATVTLPTEGDPFVRAVAGADGRPTTTTTLTGEVYLQTFGAGDPSGYLDILASERVARGEVWAAGQMYAAVSVAQEITPLFVTNLAVIGNLRDPSALVTAAASWSVADNAVVAFGVYVGVGARPDTIDLDLAVDPTSGAVAPALPTSEVIAASVSSEFGLYPSMGFVQVRTYF